MSHDFAYDVFISYASPDLDLAEGVHRRLTGVGLKVWFDKARLNPGCDWHKEIEAGCEASRIVLPVLTPRWKLSEWTKFETYGAESTIPLIFVSPFAEIFTPPLTRFQGQAIDLAHGDEAAWGRLISAITELLALPAPDKLARLADVRYAANPYFVGREADLNRIHEALHQNPTAVLTQGRVRAITALGGIGKTTLARQYIEKFWRCYPHIFWVDCRLGIETEFARLCDLFLPEYRDETNVGQKARLTLRELQSRSDRLLILDNADDEASNQEWIPKSGHCRTLITSRFAGWSAAVRSFQLDVLEPEPAQTLLTTRAGRGEFATLSPAEQTACETLAKELGYLPLALEQAAAYIGQQGLGFSFADYLRLYGEATAELLAAGVLGSTEYPDSVMTTWTTTLRKLDPAPQAIIRLCAFLAPTPLPLSVLISGIEILLAESADVARSAIASPSHPEAWVREQVGQLRKYSMVNGDGRSLLFHTLVQVVQRLYLAKPSVEYQTSLQRSLHLIDSAFVGNPNDIRNWPTLEPLVAHTVTVVRFVDEVATAGPAARLMSQVSVLLGGMGRLDEVESMMRRALEIDSVLHGDDAPQLIVRLNNLAMLLKTRNQMEEAEHLMRRALVIAKSHYEEEHPVVASALNSMGVLLLETCRYEEAEPLCRRALEIDEKAYGSQDRDVARDLNTLSQILSAVKRYEEAESMMRRMLEILRVEFGENHPKFATGLNNLGALLMTTDRSEDAEPLLRQAIEIVDSSYDGNHPDVSRSINNLAALLFAAGRFDEAEPLMRRSLTICESVLDDHHPDFALSLHNLALLCEATDRIAEAEPLMRQALAVFCRFRQVTGHETRHLRGAIADYSRLLQEMQISDPERSQRLLAVGVDPAWMQDEGTWRP